MSGISMCNRSRAISLALVGVVSIAWTAQAEVPVNDASRTTKETNIAACMQRARTYKQSTVAPSRGVTTSLSTQGDLAGVGQVNGASVSGSPLSGTTIGNSDLAILLAVGQGVTALKTKNAGQVVNALAAVAAAISSNASTLKSQQNAIGTANSLQGAMDQNSAVRLSGAQIWNQAIGAVNTTVQMRNQRLIDAAAAESAATRVMTYNPAKASFVNDDAGNGGN
ncbi:hypothetical protein [Rhizobium hainanense]|uniref:Type IV secretion system protein n=1 Tax=Rhizobium hainanense TaxID=52131 RepID=A0A1C3WKW5_9HYPH|nr:hypothetical protein [Rhizobium hainanense]SCB40506.1 hypothetical protein GA0061100_12522 [Rhizobium hainanense]